MSKPNILLIMTDQMRGDCLGIEGHPVLETPYLDYLGTSGFHFTSAYSACPVCIPARRTLMTGTRPATHGAFMNSNTPLLQPTLPEKLGEAGYQTHLVGKLHLYPLRKKYGFHSTDWSDAPHRRMDYPVLDDYQRFLQQRGITDFDMAMAHGANENGWVSRPFHLDESLHFTNWCTRKALEFLERRDPTLPFFLKVSYHQPHEPCTPPAYYFNKYMDRDIPDPHVGEWSKVFDGPQRGLPVTSWRTCLDGKVLKQYQAGYYGCINHIDDQIGYLMKHIPKETIVLFVSDHGEMLGDHQWIRKRSAFEGSARIPFLLRLPESMGIGQGRKISEPVELMDVMPTLLEAAGAVIPETVEGKSLLPLLRGDDESWRPYVHGECARMESLNSGMQYLTNGEEKYIYYPGTGEEQFFNLKDDPHEMADLSRDPPWTGRMEYYRGELIRILDGRREGFVKGGELTPTGGYAPVTADTPL